MRTEIRELKGTPSGENPYTVVFIDYESLYYSFLQQYSVPPDLEYLVEDMKKCGRIIKIKVFGDFSRNGMQQERNRIRTITSDIIDCARGDEKVQKDYTDFIMLDHIYQESVQNPSVQQFILFTGDGHFASAATFLRTFMDKTVGIYGIRNTLSRQLMDCSTWTKIVEVFDIDEEKYQLNLIHNFRLAKEKGLILTFMRTVEHVAEHYGGEKLKYQDALGKMIESGYVETYMTSGIHNKKPFRALSPNWDKLDQLQNEIQAKEKSLR